MHQIEQSPIRAGSNDDRYQFFYMVYFMIGRGHGKFGIASYLSTHESKLTASMRKLKVSFSAGIVASNYLSSSCTNAFIFKLF